MLREALASLAGFEPATGCLEGSCSIQLSYRDACGKRINQFSNRIIDGQAKSGIAAAPQRLPCGGQVGARMRRHRACRFSAFHQVNGSRIRRVAVAQRA